VNRAISSPPSLRPRGPRIVASGHSVHLAPLGEVVADDPGELLGRIAHGVAAIGEEALRDLRILQRLHDGRMQGG